MANWKETIQRLRENQERNAKNYKLQSKKAEERRTFLNEIYDEQARIISSTKRNRNSYKSVNSIQEIDR